MKEDNERREDDIFVEDKLLADAFTIFSLTQNGNVSEPFSICHRAYHYTTTDTLDKMLTYGKLRATNVYYLNDTGEMRFGIEKIKHILGQANMDPKLNLVPYTISFSSEGDLLNQWVCYGKESGVSIGFDFPDGAEEGFFLRVGEVVLPSSNCYPRYMYYLSGDNTGQDEELEEAVKKMEQGIKDCEARQTRNNGIDGSVANEITVKLLATYLKREEFQGEKEARIVVFPLKSFDNGELSKISFSCNPKGILKPYVEVVCCEIGKQGVPISSITVGPSGNQDAVFQSVILRLEYGECKVYPFSAERKMKHKEEYCEAFLEKYREKMKAGKDLTDEEKHNICAILNGAIGDRVDERLLKCVKELQKTECYYCEKYGIYLKKSKIPYLFT